MKLSFSLHYYANPGETLHVILKRSPSHGVKKQINIPLTCKGSACWQGEGLFLLKEPVDLSYHYEVRHGIKICRREWPCKPRHLHLIPSKKEYILNDQWRDLPTDSWLYSSALEHISRQRPPLFSSAEIFENTLCLYVQSTTSQDLYMSGNLPLLGKWDPAHALRLHPTAINEWACFLNTQGISTPFEYKFFVRHPQTNQITWEQGPNRTLRILPNAPLETHIYNDLRPQFPPEKPFRAAGVVLPVFSLRSKGSAGVGDFGDLLKLTDWAVLTGQKIIQLLPVHDTSQTKTWQDSYPYKAISIYAFHPLYTDLRQLPPLPAKDEKKFEKQRQYLNDMSQVDYESALHLKIQRLKQAFEQEGEHVLGTPEFHLFFHQNAHWLPAYAMFCTLRDTYHTADFTTWPEHNTFCEEELHRFCTTGTPHEKEVRFWYYVQFILHSQLQKATQYARRHHVILKGDIPIGISPHSVEAWMEPHLFYLNTQAGAPPDDFSATGQNWGFPTYNWSNMAREHYRWWQKRLIHMARYFDAYRIDHVLGFFRIWEIPDFCVDGLLGQFSPALPLTQEEIAAYGLSFRPEFLHPYITEDLLKKYFGKWTEEIKANFLEPLGNDRFRLRAGNNTQQSIATRLKNRTDKKTNQIRQGLFTLITNVLFVSDRTHPHLFHPRIAALNCEAMGQLTESEKKSFSRLYTDYFFRRHNDFWAENALRKLPALVQSTRMLCCAEDLGMVPACVPDVMRQLQMLSLEIQRMPKNVGEQFADTRRYPYLSVATPSTHDMSVLRGWWEENQVITQQFWHEVLNKSGPAPQEAGPEICEEILNKHLQSPSMLALISFQDWTSMDKNLRAPDPAMERINIPADPHHYWRYRMHITLEELIKEDAFNTKIKAMLAMSQR